MIVDRLDAADRYARLHPGLARALEFLRSPGLAERPAGRHDLDGDRLFALVAADEGRGREGARLEAHRTYIDVQYTVEGGEEIGWRPLADCRKIDSPYDASRDIGFFGDEPASWLCVGPGMLAIFFPQDAHAPLGGTGRLHKVVIKVAVEP